MNVEKRKQISKQRATKVTSILSSHELPKEILFEIFSYLDAPSLCAVCEVSRLWRVVAYDKRLWLALYRNTVNKSTNLPLPENLKLAVVNAAISKQNTQCSRMRRHVDSLSGSVGSHKDFLEKMNPTFYVEWIQKDGKKDVFAHSDVCAFKTTIQLRFYNSFDMSLDDIVRVKVKATTPIFIGSKWPNHASTVLYFPFQKNMINSTTRLAGDELISLYKVNENFAIAFWNNATNSKGVSNPEANVRGENVTFVIISIPAHKLVERSLNGHQNLLILPRPLKPLNTSLEALTNELSRFSCFFELRNSRESFWTEKTNPKVIPEGNSAILVVINRDSANSSWAIQKDSLAFLWKTELFKGKIQNLCFVDFTLLDTENNPIALFSSLAKFEEISGNNYDYSEGEMLRLVAADSFCEILIEIFHESPERKCFIRHAQVKIFNVAALYDGASKNEDKKKSKVFKPQGLNDDMAAYVELYNENNNNNNNKSNSSSSEKSKSANRRASNTSSSTSSSSASKKSVKKMWSSPPGEKW